MNQQEHHTTTTGRTKFWRSNPLPEKPSWTPKRPLIQQQRQANKNPKRFSGGKRKRMDARNRKICELRAKGKSVKLLAREFGLHATRIRYILDENMTPEEILLDEQHTREALRHEVEGEAQRAVDLRRSGMKFKDVAIALGRSLATTIKLIRKLMPPEEIAHRAYEGKAHYRATPDPTPKLIRRRTYIEELKTGKRQTDCRPMRDVASFVTVPPPFNRSGGTRHYTLTCGHVVVDDCSKPPYKRKRCNLCPKVCSQTDL